MLGTQLRTRNMIRIRRQGRKDSEFLGNSHESHVCTVERQNSNTSGLNQV